MFEDFLNFKWPRADRRAWNFSLSILVLVLCLFFAAWWKGDSWTIRQGLDYIPREISIPAYEIPSDLVEFSLGLPNYTFGEYFTLKTLLPPDLLVTSVILTFLLALALLAAGVSYFEGIWLYGSLALMVAGAAVFEPDLFLNRWFSGKWLTAGLILLFVLPVYLISNWRQHWNLSRRWWVLLFFYLVSTLLFHGPAFDSARQFHLMAGLYLPLLVAALAFVVINSADVLHGVLILLTRGQGNTQSWLHFTVFSVFYLANFILLYLKNTGQFSLDIYYFNPFVLQLFSMLAGFWVLPAREAMGGGDGGFAKGFSSLYSSLAVFFLLAAAFAFGSASDLMVEVLEDGITLINFCMGLCFFLYVLINFYDLMFHGLRVHEVLFRPRYMPVSGIAVFGLGGVLVFLLNGGYFPFFQAMAGRYVVFGDYARREGKALIAEEYYRQALAMESRNQRANLSLAVLYLETGNPQKAFQAAEISLAKNPVPEAYLVMARVYRDRGQNLEEILCLQEGAKQFPNDGRILNNTGIAFSTTVYPDSARYYFSLAAERPASSSEGKANLAFHFLCHGNFSEGMPSRAPESEGDWSALNNQLVFANIAHEPSSAIDGVVRRFKEAPEEIRPYLYYHSLINKSINRDSTALAGLVALEDDSIRKYYSEAVEMAKALLNYRTGSVQHGLDRLLHLYESGTRTRHDFGLLLGQVYYDQGAYASAAGYFRNAAQAGMKNAWYWYAVACLDAGKKEEAAFALREAIPHLRPQEKIRASILADGLSSTSFAHAIRRSDPEKSAFIKVNWNTLSIPQLRDLIHSTGDKDAKRFLWKYCFDRAYRESRGRVCRELSNYARRFYGKSKKWEELLQNASLKSLEISGDFKELEKREKGLPAFMKGRLAESRKDLNAAAGFYRAALESNPLDSRQALLSVMALEKAGLRSEAYESALQLTRLDPQSPDFLELYAITALHNGLADFAFQCLPRLEVLSSEGRAASLKKSMEAELKAKNLPLPLGSEH